jgi:ankyrin repeat protein
MMFLCEFDNGEEPPEIDKPSPCSVALQSLLDHKADLNLQDNDGRTALIHAINHYHGEKAAAALLKAGADAKLRDKSGNDALMYALRSTQILDSVISEIIDQNPDPSLTDKDGNTHLLLAGKTGNFTAASQLLELSASPHQANKAGQRLIHFTAQHSPVYSQEPTDFTEKLIALGVDATVCDNTGGNALHYLAKSKRYAVTSKRDFEITYASLSKLTLHDEN